MKKILIFIFSIMALSLTTGLFISSSPVLANPLLEEMDDLIVLEGDLNDVDVEALVAEVIAEGSLYDVAEIEALIEETIASSRAVYILNQPLHLSFFLDGYIVNNGDTVILGSNIDMSTLPPLSGRSYFNGIFNGNGFTVSNLRIESSGLSVGFINESSQITLENVTFENLQVTGNASSNTGSLIGLLSSFGYFGSSTIDNVHITGNSFVREGISIGGFVGRVEGTSLHILNSKNYATVENTLSSSSLGGFIAEAVSSDIYISDSENHGRVIDRFGSLSTAVAGFIGRASGNYAGPSVMVNFIEISDSINYGPISGGGTAAGFIGIMSDQAYNHLNTLIENCTNHGYIGDNGVFPAGGIIGGAAIYFGQVVIINVYNSGRIEGRMSGGMIGSVGSDRASTTEFILIDVQNSGNISGAEAGGIIGHIANSKIKIQDAINTGDVLNSIISAGGIIGFIGDSEVEIQDATNSGMVSGYYAGGILGAVFGNSYVIVTNWSNTGLIFGTQNAGQGVGFVDSGSTVIM